MTQLFLLVIKQFLWLVMVANLLAIPVAYFSMKEWLAGFASKTPINPTVFVYTLFGSILLVLAVVSYNTVRSALQNPVDVIKSE